MNRPTRRGYTIVYAIVILPLLLGVVSLAVDFARVQMAKSELLHAATAAARGAAIQLSNGVTATQNAAVTWGAKNTASGSSVVIDPNNDVVFGTWDPSTRTFMTLTGAARSGANAVQVNAHLWASRGTGVSLMFGQIFGRATCDVNASAVAMAVAGQPYGLVGLSSVTISNCNIDSYNSSQGSYASTQGNNAHIASNGNVSVSGASVGGDAQPGPTGSFSGARGDVTGSVAPLTQALSYPTPSAGSYATTNSNSNVSGYVSSGSFTLSSGVCNMPGGTYYFSNFNVMGGTLNCTGPVTIYVTGNMQIASTVSTYQNIPANLQILGTGSGTLQVTAGGTIYCDMYAPSATVKLLASGTYYGALVGNTLNIMASAIVHEDDALSFATSGAVTIVK